jgi:hypothetical protein
MSEVRRTLPPPVRPRRDSASIAPPTHRATSDGNDACDALLLLTAPQEPAELPPPSLVRARPPPPPTRPPPLRPYLPVAASDGPVDQLNASNTTTADASAEEGSAVVQPTPSPRNARKMSTQTPRPEKPTRPAPELDHGSPCRAAPSPARRPSRPDLLPFQPESRLPSRCDTITGVTPSTVHSTRPSLPHPPVGKMVDTSPLKKPPMHLIDFDVRSVGSCGWVGGWLGVGGVLVCQIVCFLDGNEAHLSRDSLVPQPRSTRSHHTVITTYPKEYCLCVPDGSAPARQSASTVSTCKSGGDHDG